MRPCPKCGGSERLKNGKCRPCNKAIAAIYRAKNAEKVKALARANYLATRDSQLAVQKARRSANPALYAERVKAWVDVNPERMSELRKRWKKENKERVCAHSQKRRALIANAEGEITASDIQRLLILQKSKCASCRASLANAYHLDHIIALACGGTNSPANAQLLCPTCNLQKGVKHPVDFMQSKGFLL